GLRQLLHVVLGAEVQAAGGTGPDARGLEPLADAVHAERALEHLARLRAELRDVEGTAGDAIATPDPLLLLEVPDAVGILDNGAVGRTRLQPPRLRAVHALVLAHQHHQAAAAP